MHIFLSPADFHFLPKNNYQNKSNTPHNQCYSYDDDFKFAPELNSQKSKTSLQEGKPKDQTKPSLRVMKIEGDKIIINAGSTHKVRSGLVGYVIDKSDFGTYRYLARFVVEQVFDKSARCIVLEGSDNLAKEGQDVVIK